MYPYLQESTSVMQFSGRMLTFPFRHDGIRERDQQSRDSLIFLSEATCTRPSPSYYSHCFISTTFDHSWQYIYDHEMTPF